MPSHSSLSDIVAHLAILGAWETAHGPRHPTEPEPALATEIAEFLATYPILRRDASYVDFLEIYAGAHLFPKEPSPLTRELPDHSYRVETNTVDLFGFSHTVSLHIALEDEDGLPIVDPEGFLQVAILNVILYKLDESLPGDTMLFADKLIAYDTTGERPWGVYAKADRIAEPGPVAQWSMPSYQRCWDTFRDFLADVATGAVLLSPSTCK